MPISADGADAIQYIGTSERNGMNFKEYNIKKYDSW